MTCNNCQYFHRTTALSTTGALTVTNPNNVGNFDKFCMCMSINPDTVITGAPVALTITLNGADVPVIDEWGYPVTTDRIRPRRVYKGRFITVAGNSHVTFLNVPCIPSSATASVTASTTSEG